MQQLRGSLVQKQPQGKTYVSKDMDSTTHLFVHHDAIPKPLKPPYDGPYHILKRDNKHYMFDIAGRPEVVSVDHFEPAYLENDLVTAIDTSTQATSTALPAKYPVTITRSGRRVHMPV